MKTGPNVHNDKGDVQTNSNYGGRNVPKIEIENVEHDQTGVHRSAATPYRYVSIHHLTPQAKRKLFNEP